MKTVIVSGASGNLGQAIVNKFLSEDFNVIGTVTGKKNLSFSDNKNFEAFEIDLTLEQAANNFVAAVISKYQRIDAAVLTVGGFAGGKIEETGLAEIEQQYHLNFVTAYNLARPIFNHMMKEGAGRIFLTGSRTGSDMKFSKGLVAYGLSKSLIFRLAELMNEEAKGTNVVTSVLSPSTIDTPQNREAMPQADFSKWVKAEAIADIVYTYCTPAAIAIREPVIKVYNNA